MTVAATFPVWEGEPMNRIARAAALALVAVAALTGCLRYNVDMTLSSDDTASGTVILAVQSGVGEALGVESDEAALDSLFEGETFGEGFVETEYAADDYVGKQYTFTDLPITELGDFADLFTVTREGDTFVVSGDTPPMTEEELAEVPEGAESQLSITFPGEVTDHNGTLEDKTVTWDLFATTEPLSATAGATSGSAFPLMLILAIVGGLLVLTAIAVVVIVVIRKAKKPAIDPSYTPAPPAAPFTPDAPPAPPAPPVAE